MFFVFIYLLPPSQAIAAVDGIDALFIGPSDLAADMGRLANPKHPEVQAAIADACQRMRAIGKPLGMLTGDLEEAVRAFLTLIRPSYFRRLLAPSNRPEFDFHSLLLSQGRYFEQGFTFVALGSDAVHDVPVILLNAELPFLTFLLCLRSRPGSAGCCHSPHRGRWARAHCTNCRRKRCQRHACTQRVTQLSFNP